MDGRTVLVAIDHGTDRSAVVIDAEGDVWLIGSMEWGGGTRLDDFRPTSTGLDNGREIIGGRLPPGAVAAEVVTDRGDRVLAQVGGGAWIVALDEPLSGFPNPVVRRDPTGAPVAPRLPESWSRAPVTDSDNRCPACDALAWDVVTPADGSRGENDGGVPAPMIVCRVCGHEEPMGSILRIAVDEDEDPAVVDARVRHEDEMRRLRQGMLLSAVGFPIYAIDGLSGRVGGSGSRGDDVCSLTVAHGARLAGAEVTTALDECQPPHDAETIVRAALAGQLQFALTDRTDGSDAAFVLRLHANQRASARAAARARISAREIAVDDVAHRFTCVEAGTSWAAITQTEGLTVTLVATDVDVGSIRLRRVPDPVATLL